jgi:hypothetical protein
LLPERDAVARERQDSNLLICCALLLALVFAACAPSSAEKPATVAATREHAAVVAPAFTPEDAPLPPEQTGGFDAARAYAHVAKQVSFGPRPPGSEAIRRTQEYLRSELTSYGCAVEEDNFTAQTPLGAMMMKNIVAKIPGASQEIVLLLTHYDTLRKENFVGANDPGSSVGVMLEVARLLCGKKRGLSVWIAFLDGEEALVQWTATDSVYGSRQLAAKLALSGELKHVKAVLLADIVGQRDVKLKRESNSTPWLADLMWATAGRLGYSNTFVSDEIGGIQDDHLPFLARKVPAVDLIAGDYVGRPPWHTTEDSLDKISPRSLGIVGHVLIETVAALEHKFR